MNQNIDNSQDLLDSRDVIKRFEELESEREELATASSEANDALEAARNEGHTESIEHAELEFEQARRELIGWDEDYAAEHKALSGFIAKGPDGWRHGETLIRDSYFEEYAQDLAEEIGATDSNAARGWPLNCIDWEQAARELKMDYTSADFDGVTYWYRG